MVTTNLDPGDETVVVSTHANRAVKRVFRASTAKLRNAHALQRLGAQFRLPKMALTTRWCNLVAPSSVDSEVFGWARPPETIRLKRRFDAVGENYGER